MFFITVPDIYSLLPLRPAQIFVTKYILWIKACCCVSMTQASLEQHDIFNGFYVATIRALQWMRLSHSSLSFRFEL